MKSKAIIVVLAATLGVVARADFSSVFDGGWRISAGAVYDPGLNANIRFTPHASYVTPFTPGMSSADAFDRAKNGSVGSGRTGGQTRHTFGGGAWYDTDDPVYSGGDDPGRTRYYRFPRSIYREGSSTFDLGSTAYSDVQDVVYGRQPSAWADDESGMLGVNIELSRNLYHDEDIGWGVDAAFAVSYFRHNGLFSAAMSWLNGSSTSRSGSYQSTLDLGDDYDDWNWHEDEDGAYYGAGDYSGNAGPISPSVSVSKSETVRTDSSYGALEAEGDYEDLELILLARPYYDVFDWLRVNVMAGLVVSRQDLDFSMTMMRDGMPTYSRGRDFSQWDVYGVAGAGLMVYYKDFTLAADFLARFLDRDLDVNDSENGVRGSVQRGRWMFKISAGYEF